MVLNFRFSIGVHRRLPSQYGTARGDWPQRLDPAVADAHIPVVEIDGRIAVPGDELQLVAHVEARRLPRAHPFEDLLTCANAGAQF